MTTAWRDPYDEKLNQKIRKQYITDCGTESPTQQGFAKDADINEIVRRCGITERMPVVPIDPNAYGDISMVNDLGDALRVVKEAQDAFMALPVKVRNRFNNSPAELWDFVQDDANYEEAQRLGLLKEAEPPASQAAPVEPIS